MEPADENFQAAFMSLFADIQDEQEFPNQRPLLAHYTSVETCEQILKHNQIWFSNPLLMNDRQELRWGILEGTRGAITNERIREACGTPDRANELENQIERYQSKFEDEHALDTYIFCLSQHEPNDSDGLLSMWRGYGASGGGIAVVLDTAKFNGQEGQRLVLARVHYASDDERRKWLDSLYERFANILMDTAVPTDKLFLAAYWLFERLKLFALFSKHKGFREEREWRAVYMPWWDDDGHFKKYLGYTVTPSGVHPKLKLPISEIPLIDQSECVLEKIVARIILGPTIS